MAPVFPGRALRTEGEAGKETGARTVVAGRPAGALGENPGAMQKKAYVTLKEGQSLDLLGSAEE